jgi:predicted AlkP superfamily phosphohydrolase/phosphomutase
LNRSSAASRPATTKRLYILGIDGMDPKLLKNLMDAGRMPNFSKVAAAGAFLSLGTSMPPQSPVAWSSFIAGAGPGTHQIYDFIHRDPHPDAEGLAIEPYLSTSRVERPRHDWAITVGSWRIPLFGGKTLPLRRGVAFWDYLVGQGIETTIYRIPATYPPPVVEGHGEFHCLCGMGTPDLLGTYGEFTLFTPEAPVEGERVSGGHISRLEMINHRGKAALIGPDNYLRKPSKGKKAPKLELELEVVRDPEKNVAKILICGRRILLNAGEWSDWTPIQFDTGIPASSLLGAMQLPTSVSGMVRFYLKRAHPKLELYATPLNIDPLDQVNPIAAPKEFAEDIASACGRYYTAGIPEDTKALRSRALTEDEFLSQVSLLKAERVTQFRYALEQFDRGCLFFYFGHIDQLSHIFWRDRDQEHPAYDPEQGSRYGTLIDDEYVQMDALLGEALAALRGDDTIIIMSDHGFTSFRRGFNLNTWLKENGYLALARPAEKGACPSIGDLDWKRTKAYALGLNALHINLAGREKNGIVRGEEQKALLGEIRSKLLELRDKNGARIVQTAPIVADAYPGADPKVAPDLLVGYADTYRGSWDTAIGNTPAELLEDNHDRWSGDHCVAHEIVPGILLMNREAAVTDPDLTDLAPTILSEFGIHAPREMTGRVIIARKAVRE